MKSLKKIILLTVCFWWLLLSSYMPVSAVNEKPLRIAETYIGITEKKNPNIVKKFLETVNRKLGDSWCAAFVSYCLERCNISEPKIRSGLAQKFITKKSIKAIDVLRNKIVIPAGSLAIWKKGETPFGHIGFVRYEFIGQNFFTVEGNTSPTDAGSQSNGHGVFAKKRSIKPYSYFRIEFFTLVS